MYSFRFVSFILSLLSCTLLSAQELTVKSFSLSQNEIIPSQDKRNDLTQKPCALLKIQMVDQLEKVEGNVMGSIVDNGTEKWVYVTNGTYHLRLYPKNHLPLDFNIMENDYGVSQMEGNRVYILKLTNNDFTPSPSVHNGAIKLFCDTNYVKGEKDWMLLKVNFNYLDSEPLQKKFSSVLFNAESPSLQDAYQKYIRSFNERRSYEKFSSPNNNVIELSVWPLKTYPKVSNYAVRYCKRWTEKRYEKSQLRYEQILFDTENNRVLSLDDVLVPGKANIIKESMDKAMLSCCMEADDQELKIFYFKKGRSGRIFGTPTTTESINYGESPEVFSDYFFQLMNLDKAFLVVEKQKRFQRIDDERKEVWANDPNVDDKDKLPVFDVVSEMPSFKGGDSALVEWLSKNINYPVVAEENGIEGRVVCTFVVDTDGSITDLKVVKPVDPSLDKEARRVLGSMPKWNPGKQGGKPVRVKYTTPVTFSLQGNKAKRRSSNGGKENTKDVIRDKETNINYEIEDGAAKVKEGVQTMTLNSLNSRASWQAGSINVKGDVVIPKTITKEGKIYNVTSIGELAFYDCSKISSLDIPESVTTIGMLAFSGCSNLTSVNIPKGVTHLNWSVFERCQSLTFIDIPENVMVIDNGAFSKCTSLTSISIPDKVTRIGKNAFHYDSGLKTVKIGESVETIDEYAFQHCSGLSEINLVKSLKKIGKGAFNGCPLTKVKSNFPNPFPLEMSVFDNNVYETATLIVPKGTKWKYEKMVGWKAFKHIEEMEFETSVTENALTNSNSKPMQAENYLNVSDSCKKQKDFPKAIEYYKKYLELKVNADAVDYAGLPLLYNSQALNIRGDRKMSDLTPKESAAVMENMKKADEAYALLSEKFSDAEEYALWQRGRLNAQMDDADMSQALAVPYFTRLAELITAHEEMNANDKRRFFDAYAYLMRYHLKQKENQKSYEYALKLQELEPGDPDVKRAVEALEKVVK